MGKAWNNHFWQRGSSGILVLLLGVVIVGAFFLVGGIPQLPLSQTDQSGTVELVAETPGAGRSNLQLQTLKFRNCTNIVSVDLLLDRSGSMKYKTLSGEKKIKRLTQAVQALADNLTDQSIFGFQSFSGEAGRDISLTNDVPISYFKDVKKIIPQKLKDLTPDGATPTSDALKFSLPLLREAVVKYPDRKFNFIFVSDGNPQPSSQDPRLPQNAPNPADEIKKLGVSVYTVGVYGINGDISSPDYGKLESKNSTLTELLKSLASRPENYYEASTGDEITQILSQISNKICKDDGTTSTAPTSTQ